MCLARPTAFTCSLSSEKEMPSAATRANVPTAARNSSMNWSSVGVRQRTASSPTTLKRAADSRSFFMEKTGGRGLGLERGAVHAAVGVVEFVEAQGPPAVDQLVIMNHDITSGVIRRAAAPRRRAPRPGRRRTEAETAAGNVAWGGEARG